MNKEIEDQLTEVLRDVFDDDTLVARPDLIARDVDGWDSLSHIRLLLTVERRFQIKFTASEVGHLQSLGELAQLIELKREKSSRNT